MDTRIHKLRSGLNFDGDVWKTVHESEDEASLHFVVERQYDARTKKVFRSDFVQDVTCYVGFHLYDIGGRNKQDIVVNAVYHDKEDHTDKVADAVYRKRYAVPINLSFVDTFEIDLDKMSVRGRNARKTPDDLLGFIYERHIRATRPLKGLFVRLKVFVIRDIIRRIPEAVAGMLRGVLFVMSGIRFKKKTTDIHIDELLVTKNELTKKDDTKMIEFMQIKVNAISAFTYSAFHLVAAFLYVSLSLHNSFVSKVFGNVFLVLAYAVVSIALWERFIPKMLEKAIRKLAKIAFDLQLKKIRL